MERNITKYFKSFFNMTGRSSAYIKVLETINSIFAENRNKIRILFLCTANSCRSQMAEGFVKHLMKEYIEAWSAGIEKKDIDPLAIEVMSELNIDIANQKSKLIFDLPENLEFDYVIALCDNTNEGCPVFANAGCPVFPSKTSILHRGFNDPPELAKGAMSRKDALRQYRLVRDEIKIFIEGLPNNLKQSTV